MIPCLFPTWIKVEIILHSEEAIISLHALQFWKTSDSYNFPDCILSSTSHLLPFLLTIMLLLPVTKFTTWFQASAAKWMRTVPFWAATQHVQVPCHYTHSSPEEHSFKNLHHIYIVTFKIVSIILPNEQKLKALTINTLAADIPIKQFNAQNAKQQL